MKKITFALLIALLLTSCSSFLEPPYTVKKEKHIITNYLKIQIFDIEKDGHDEIFSLGQPSKMNFASKIRVLDHTGSNIIKEYPFSFFVYDFSVCDIDNKGSNYIIVPYTIGNQSFIQLIEIDLSKESGRDKYDILISTGQKTFPNERDTTWSGSVVTAGFADLNHDGSKDVILLMQVNYDDGERGVAAVDIKNKKLLWKYPAGSRIQYPKILDIDKDGELEIFLNTCSPQNGLSVNGTNDTQAYYLVLNEKGEEVVKTTYGDPGGMLTNQLIDIDSDGRKEIIQVYYGSFVSALANSHVRVLEWGKTEGRIYNIFPGGLSDYVFLQGDKESKFYLAFIEQNKKNKLKIYNDKFLPHKIINLDKEYVRIETTADLDKDTRDDLLLIPHGHSQRLVLSADFDPIIKIDNLLQFVWYQDFNAATYRLYAYFTDRSLWQVSFKYNWARFKLPGIFLGIILPWLLLIVLGIFLRKYKRKPAKPAFQNHYLDHLSTGVIFIDKDDQVLFMNSRANQLLEIKISHMPVKLKIVIESVPNELAIKLKESLSSQTGSSFEFSFGVGNNIRHLFFNVVSLTDKPDQSGGTLITIEDITKIVHSQRSIAFASLTQHLAHDIKNPLSNVRLILERLKIDSQKLPQSFQGKLSEYLNSIEKDVNLVRNVTNSFMQFSNLSKPKKEPTDIHLLIQSTLEKKLPLVKDRIKFETNFIKEDILLNIDKEQIIRAIDNILDNSIRAITDKGTIIVSTRLAEHIIKETGLSEKFFELEIEDSGKGIKAQLIDNIFEPFISHSKGGTGLGLAIVKKIVDDHSGKVTLHSKVGVGTRVSLLLPNVFRQDEQDLQD